LRKIYRVRSDDQDLNDLVYTRKSLRKTIEQDLMMIKIDLSVKKLFKLLRSDDVARIPSLIGGKVKSFVLS